MSNLAELKRLEANLNKSEDLRKKLDKTARRIAEEGKVGSDGEAMAVAARKLGYDITVADLERASVRSTKRDRFYRHLKSNRVRIPNYQINI